MPRTTTILTSLALATALAAPSAHAAEARKGDRPVAPTCAAIIAKHAAALTDAERVTVTAACTTRDRDIVDARGDRREARTTLQAAVKDARADHRAAVEAAKGKPKAERAKARKAAAAERAKAIRAARTTFREEARETRKAVRSARAEFRKVLRAGTAKAG